MTLALTILDASGHVTSEGIALGLVVLAVLAFSALWFIAAKGSID